MNVEIGNPAYKIYEGEPDDDAGELLDADFTLDPDKVEKNTKCAEVYTLVLVPAHIITSNGLLSLFSPLTSQTQCMPRCTWAPTTAATLWPARMRRRSCYHVEMRSPLWTPWHRLSIGLDHIIPNMPLFLPFKKKKHNKKSLTSERKLLKKSVNTV